MIQKQLKKRILSSVILLPLTIFIIFQDSFFFTLFLIFFFLICSYEWVNINKNFFLKILGVTYLLIITYLIYLFKYYFFLQFIFVLIICIFTDIGGYLFGKLFKGPKFTKISPQKTYSGLIGSFILSLLISVTYTKHVVFGKLVYLEILNLFQLKNLENYNFYFIILILLISLTSQIGDLIISYFKRTAKIKDTGNLIPGHGGLLDRVDGMIFAMPASYLLFNYLSL